jgi:hypothetical protein
MLRDMLGPYLTDLSKTNLTVRADAVFDFLVASTAIHTLTVGVSDLDEFCDRTANALTALAYSGWVPPRGRGDSPKSRR